MVDFFVPMIDEVRIYNIARQLDEGLNDLFIVSSFLQTFVWPSTPIRQSGEWAMLLCKNSTVA